MARILVWFRRDLRLHDHLPLCEALAAADEIIPFYAFDPAEYRSGPYGFPKTGSFRAQFIRESVADLQGACAQMGAHLQIFHASPAQAMATLHRQFSFSAVYCAGEVTAEELEQEAAVRRCGEKCGFVLRTFSHYTLYHPQDLPFELSQMPGVFTGFRKKLEKYSALRQPLPQPTALPTPSGLDPIALPGLSDLGLAPRRPDARAACTFRGGAAAGWERMQHYFWETEKLSEYKQRRNGLLGADYSSKFSPWLAQGCLSPRSIAAEVARYERNVTKNSSTYWLIFELLWRDFFRFSAAAEKDHFFRMPRHAEPAVSTSFEAWRRGVCGQDFCDANMRELLLTGFMSNRGRQNVASYLVKDLGQPWVAGAAWFESQLIDYDVCSNYGNWAYVAGVGHDPRSNRYFNLDSQAERFDAAGEYRRHWR